jgi:hypothetical protein
MDSLEVDAAVLVGVPGLSEETKRLVFVGELIAELRLVKQRLVKLERWKATHDGNLEGASEDRPKVETPWRGRGVGRPGNTVPNDLLPTLEENSQPEQESGAPGELVDEIVADTLYRETARDAEGD